MATLRIGAHGLNHTLRAKHIFADRTTRTTTIATKNAEKQGSGLRYCRELAMQNLQDLYKIIVWSHEHGIDFYRITSNLFPHIANPQYIHGPYTSLAYSLEPFRPILKQIGDYANAHKMRLTFHPGQYTRLNPLDDNILLNSKRDLHLHCTLLDMMGMGPDSICVIHGGGLYDNKEESEARWIRNYKRLPAYIRHRIALENDEECYSIEDVLRMSEAVFRDTRERLPIVFDLFHYICYNDMLRKKGLQPLPKAAIFMPRVIASWGRRTVKMHYSEQKPHASIGSHSTYVSSLPPLILNFTKKYGHSLDVMIEAKANERATLRLKKMYGL